MNGKIVRIRKDHDCAHCEEIIKSGSNADFMSFRRPRHDEEDNQVGIWYERFYFCENTDICIKTANKKSDEQANF